MNTPQCYVVRRMPTVYYAHKHQDLDAVHYLIQKEHNIMGIESVSVLQWQLLS